MLFAVRKWETTSFFCYKRADLFLHLLLRESK